MEKPQTHSAKSSAAAASIERIVSRGWTYDFFQAVWLLERADDGHVPTGERGPVAQEGIRFRPDVSMGFPATDIRRIERHEDPLGSGGHYLVEVSFMGLYGVSTPLPVHYAVDVLRSVDEAPATTVGEGSTVPSLSRDRTATGSETEVKSEPLRDFLDIFNHRLISLFYRGWLKYRYDRAFTVPKRDAITDYLLWLIGCPRSYDRETLGAEPLELLRYAGVLTQHPRSAATLEGVLFDYWLGLPVSVQQCTGRWVAIAPADQNRIGALNTRLGEDVTIGEQIYDLSGSFNITLGPMDWSTYLLFLPGEACHDETCSFVRLYCADPLAFTLELSLKENEAPPTRLSSEAAAGRLGYTTWLRTSELPATSVTFGTSAADRWLGRREARQEESPADAPEASTAAPNAGRTAAW